MRKTLLVCLSIAFFLASLALLPGTASAAEVTTSPTSLSFGQVAVNAKSAAQTVVVTNENRHPISISKVYSSSTEFVILSPSLPLQVAADGKTSFQVLFEPTVASTFKAVVIVVVSGRGGTYNLSVPIVGTGQGSTSSTPPAASSLTGSASSLSFGNTAVGSSTSQILTLSNAGKSSIAITKMTASGAGFSYSNFAATETLLAGQSIHVTVTFTPTAAGNATGSLLITSNASNSSASIPLAGTGVQSQISVTPASISFGSVSVGVTDTQSVTVKNIGNSNLTISQATLGGSSFTMSGMATPMSIAPGGSTTITVAFKPATASTFYANLSLVNSSPTSPLVIPLSGSSVASVLQLSASPTSLNFGSLKTSTSSTQTVTLTNTGNSSVSISKITVTGSGFTSTSVALPVTVAAGQSTSFGVQFDPASAGSMTGIATVTSNASNSPLSIALSGTGTAPTTNYSVALSWAAGTTSITGYNIYRGTSSGGPYSKLNSSLLTSTSYSDTSVTAGTTYYYVATEQNSSGQESTYSNQVTLAIP
jgi:hypothetical protein